MKIGETITHDGVTAMLGYGTECTNCCFLTYNCGSYKNDANIRLVSLCLAQNDTDDDGIFIQIEST